MKVKGSGWEWGVGWSSEWLHLKTCRGRQQQCPRYQFLRCSLVSSGEEEGKTHRCEFSLFKNLIGDYTHHVPEELMFRWIFTAQNFTDHVVHITDMKSNPVKEAKQKGTSFVQRRFHSVSSQLFVLKLLFYMLLTLMVWQSLDEVYWWDFYLPHSNSEGMEFLK